jgi:hypothetical protein
MPTLTHERDALDEKTHHAAASAMTTFLTAPLSKKSTSSS